MQHENPYSLFLPTPIRGKAPTAIDLFSGAGGLSLGIANSGFDLRCSAEIDSACASTHAKNFPSTPLLNKDIRKVSATSLLEMAKLKKGDLDLLVGGPPCQGFSIIGARQTSDPRNQLLLEFFRFVRDISPKCVVIENVPGLATLSKGEVLSRIGHLFDEAGYDAQCAELLAAQYGVPQMRWRMFFIGWRRDLSRSGGFPLPTHGKSQIGDLVPNRTISNDELKGFVTIREAIGDLPPIAAGEESKSYTRKPKGKYQEAMRLNAPALLSNHYAAKLSQTNIKRLMALKPGEDWRSLPIDLLPPGMQRAHRKDHTRRFRRMMWSGIARSIITRFRDPKSGEYTHPEQHRTISIREAARIQSFPDWFVFEGSLSEQYDQVGNAVPPLLARAVGNAVREVLNGKMKSEVMPVRTRYRIPSIELF